ncbi:MAG: hypothetical protein RLZZ338_4038 [Cyanobacteriota bacterium]|jgi:hypothetical protein
MLIQDLNHVEMISEETNLEGGLTQAQAGSSGFVIGFLGSLKSSAETSSSSNYGYRYYGQSNTSSAKTQASAVVFDGFATVSSGASSTAGGYYYY